MDKKKPPEGGKQGKCRPRLVSRRLSSGEERQNQGKGGQVTRAENRFKEDARPGCRGC
jgi:hypothetical protein